MLRKSDLEWIAKHFWYDTKETYGGIRRDQEAGVDPKLTVWNGIGSRTISVSDVIFAALEVIEESTERKNVGDLLIELIEE